MTPSEIALDPLDDTLWTVGENPGRLINFSKQGNQLADPLRTSTFEGNAPGGTGPEGVAVTVDGSNDSLWVVDDPAPDDTGFVPRVFHITKSGELFSGFTPFPTSNFDPAATSPQGIAVDPDGSLWIVDNASDKIYKIDSTNGHLKRSFSSPLPPTNVTSCIDPPLSGRNPQGITVDTSQSAVTLWVTDRIQGRIYHITDQGTVISSFCTTQFDLASFNPTGVAFDPGSGAVTGAKGTIPAAFPLYSSKKIEIEDDVTLNGSSVKKRKDEGYVAIASDGSWQTVSQALPKLAFESFPENKSKVKADESDSPFYSDTAVFYEEIEIDNDESAIFSGKGPFHIHKLKLKKRATVDFGEGTFYIDQVEMKEDDAAIHATKAVLYISDRFEADSKRLYLNRLGMTTGLRFVLAKDAEFKLKGDDKGDEAILKAVIYGANNKKVELEKAYVQGAIVTAGEIKVKKVSMTYTAEDQSAVGKVKP